MGGGGEALPRARRRGAAARVRRQGALQRGELLRERAPLRERAARSTSGIAVEYPTRRARRRGALPRRLQRREHLRLRQGGGALPRPRRELPRLEAPQGRALQRGALAREPAALRRGGGGLRRATRALYPDAEDAARTQFHAALIYEKMQRPQARDPGAAGVREAASRGRRSTSSSSRRTSRSPSRTGQLGDEKAARASYQAAVAEFAQRGLRPDQSPRAAAAAAEARFRLAEYDFERYDRIALPGDRPTRTSSRRRSRRSSPRRRRSRRSTTR